VSGPSTLPASIPQLLAILTFPEAGKEQAAWARGAKNMAEKNIVVVAKIFFFMLANTNINN